MEHVRQNTYARLEKARSAHGPQESHGSEKDQNMIASLLKENVALTSEIQNLKQKLDAAEKAKSQNVEGWGSLLSNLQKLHQTQLKFELGLLEKARTQEGKLTRVI